MGIHAHACTLMVVSLDSLIRPNELFNNSLSNATNEKKKAMKIEAEEAEPCFQSNKNMLPLSQSSREILTVHYRLGTVNAR